CRCGRERQSGGVAGAGGVAGGGGMITQADVLHLRFADQAVDLVFGSPPYCDCRSYDDGASPQGRTVSMDVREWVEWMLDVTTECLRVSRGAVVWMAAGPTRDRNYWPACEGLMWRWFDEERGTAYRPCYWHRVGIPGSGGDQLFRADVEYVMCFKREGKLPWTDNTAMGHPCKHPVGGEMSHRHADGQRINGRLRKTQARRKRDGERLRDGDYVAPEQASTGVLSSPGAGGGGNFGSMLCHESEAPFPEKLAEHFIRSLCPPGGTVLDPFSGSGTTRKVAIACGREGYAIDLRSSQCRLTRRRTAAVQVDLFAEAP